MTPARVSEFKARNMGEFTGSGSGVPSLPSGYTGSSMDKRGIRYGEYEVQTTIDYHQDEKV